MSNWPKSGGATNNIGVPHYEFWGGTRPPVFTPMVATEIYDHLQHEDIYITMTVE